MNIKSIKRKESVITGKRNLKHLFTYKKFPVLIGATNKSSTEDLFSEQKILICPNTGIIQLACVLPPEIVYYDFHSEALGSVWKNHNIEFLNFINKFPIKNILEIGGGNGELASNYIHQHRDATWTIVEPNPAKIYHANIRIIKKFFNKDIVNPGDYESIIHSHLFEHMYDPEEFLRSVSKILKSGNMHIFSVPNLLSYLKKGYTNVLNFEHTIFLTEYFTDFLLSRNNFKIVLKKYYLDHSIFYATQKSNHLIPFDFKSKYKEYKNLYLRYIENNSNKIQDLNKKIGKFGGPIYIFGAHIFSQFLLNQGLNDVKIEGIIDNSKLKQGKRLYGTKFKIFPPSVLTQFSSVGLILKIGSYRNEILKQILSINPKVTIFE